MLKTIIASGPVIVENGKVLLNQHGDTEFWKFCGGKMEDFDQGLFQCAQRESKEEMGIEIEKLRDEPFLIHTSKETSGGKIDIILVHFLAKRIGEIVPGEDIRKWDWIPLENLNQEPLGSNILPALKHFGFIK